MNIVKLSAGVVLLCGATVGQAQVATPGTAHPAAARGIEVITASYGTLGRERKLDIAVRLQALCGPDSLSCQVFCSETSFGRYKLGKHPICRVTYSCEAGLVRSVEAEREEPILMRCPETAEAYFTPPAPVGSDH